MTYNAPAITVLGSVKDLTLDGLNKVGRGADTYSATTPLLGSIVPVR